MAKNKIPKKIAGVKIPKVLRKNALLKGLLGSAAGRQIVADALVAAAGAAAAALVASQVVRKGGVGKAAQDAVHAGKEGTDIVEKALKEAAVAMKEVLSNAAQAALGGNDEPQPKHRRSAGTTH
jgi:hypothetical protein